MKLVKMLGVVGALEGGAIIAEKGLHDYPVAVAHLLVGFLGVESFV